MLQQSVVVPAPQSSYPSTPPNSFKAREELLTAVRQWVEETEGNIKDGQMDLSDLSDAEMKLYRRAKKFLG